MPFILAIESATSATLYRTDTAALEIFGNEPTIFGSPSVTLATWTRLLPLGDWILRATLVGALAAGMAGLFAYDLARRLLASEGGHSRLDPFLALGASLTASASLPWLTESTLIGGGAVGAALGLGLLLATSSAPRSERWMESAERPQQATRTRGRSSANRTRFGFHHTVRPLLLGAALATLLLESPWAFGGLLLFRLGQEGRFSWRPGPRVAGQATDPFAVRRGLLTSLGGLLALAFFLLPEADRLRSESVVLLAKGALQKASAVTLGQDPLALFRELGLLWFSAALFGLVQAGLTHRGRWLGWLLLLGFDLFAPDISDLSWLSLEGAQARSALHLMTLAVWSAWGALGLRTLALLLESWGVAGARLTATLLTTLGLATALAGAEDSIRSLAQTPLEATRLYRSALLDRLPPRALVLTRSPALTERLLAAQALAERPDVLVVPLRALADVRYMRDLLAREPGLEELMVDLNVRGRPGEFALHHMASRRPLYLEPDASWEPRMLAHLEPRPLLPRYSLHALGSSERRAIYEREEPILLSLLKATQGEFAVDTTTHTLILERFRDLRFSIKNVADAPTVERMAQVEEHVHALEDPTRAFTTPSSPSSRPQVGTSLSKN